MSAVLVPKSSPEDAFYENLTLNLKKVLNNIPRITNVTLEKRQPCERATVATWEQRHNVYLPDDMKRFYLSTDGFLLHWSYQYSPEDTRRVGFLSIPHLLQINLLRENVEPTVTSSPPAPYLKHGQDVSASQPNLNLRSKIFELSNICDTAKICIIYETPETANPKIFLLETLSHKWHFLADSFTEYQRMSIAHLGLPYWELCFSTCGLPSWAEQLYLLLAPHLLEKNEPRRSRTLLASHEQPPYNQLDPSIFRLKPKCVRPNQKPK
ncbi:tubulin polyglutamylase complex subunit 2 [Bradysia coprophila]|uniref:tubulin polyglutamylase complex subunit 2 n=1 Tax=Bradysia coprophila TaxID=38358 RepID=UPI00187DD068|nr:tubulin polyglutamylase complex subunit 2 [Bradysia coprophila]